MKLLHYTQVILKTHYRQGTNSHIVTSVTICSICVHSSCNWCLSVVSHKTCLMSIFSHGVFCSVMCFLCHLSRANKTPTNHHHVYESWVIHSLFSCIVNVMLLILPVFAINYWPLFSCIILFFLQFPSFFSLLLCFFHSLSSFLSHESCVFLTTDLSWVTFQTAWSGSRL